MLLPHGLAGPGPVLRLRPVLAVSVFGFNMHYLLCHPVCGPWWQAFAAGRSEHGVGPHLVSFSSIWDALEGIEVVVDMETEAEKNIYMLRGGG